METIDRAAEWRRLKELYAQMSEDELAVIADEGYQLTDLAKQVLTAEISNRKLPIQLREKPPEDGEAPEPVDDVVAISEDTEDDGGFDPSELELVPFTRVWDLKEAQETKRFLDEAGIPSYLGDDNLEQPDAIASYNGGIDLKLRPIDYQRACHASANREPDSPEPEPAADDDAEYAVKCPKCKSPNIVFEGRDGALSGNEAFNAKFEWSCDDCGHKWEDDGLEQKF